MTPVPLSPPADRPRRLQVAWPLVLTGLLAFTLGTSGGCDNNKPKTGLPTVSVSIGGKPFTLELATDFDSQRKGLMFRDSMPSDHGMIFVFPEERVLSFYMKNTRIPLDILYLDAGGRVVSIRQMQPYVLDPVSSDRPAKFAVELNQGTASAIGVKEGDVLQIPPEARPPKE